MHFYQVWDAGMRVRQTEFEKTILIKSGFTFGRSALVFIAWSLINAILQILGDLVMLSIQLLFPKYFSLGGEFASYTAKVKKPECCCFCISCFSHPNLLRVHLGKNKHLLV